MEELTLIFILLTLIAVFILDYTLVQKIRDSEDATRKEIKRVEDMVLFEKNKCYHYRLKLENHPFCSDKQKGLKSCDGCNDADCPLIKRNYK